MPAIAYETPDGINERRVDRLKYREDIESWWFYVDEDDASDNTARYIPRERVYHVERGQ